jgi:N-acetyl-gamma-glutamyl-phosphate reductase
MQIEKIAVVGASGYSGEELIRLLQQHPSADLVCVTSRQHAGQPLGAVFPKFRSKKYAALAFLPSDPKSIIDSGAKVVFLALPHGLAAEFAAPLLAAGLRVIDLSADFRLKDTAVYKEFYGHDHAAPELLPQSVYGMPELYRDKIRTANLVASPGCYPTSIILPLAPLLKAGLLDPVSIVVSSMSGVSGAGRKAETDYLFVECNESVRAYGVPKHRHLSEIEQELGNAAGTKIAINFTPHLIPVNRGILTTIYATPANGVTPEKIAAALGSAYAGEPFVRLLDGKNLPDIKNVAYTNFIDIAWRHDPHTGRIVLMSAEDNLVKGASGQAIQSLNLMCGWPETCGL